MIISFKAIRVCLSMSCIQVQKLRLSPVHKYLDIYVKLTLKDSVGFELCRNNLAKAQGSYVRMTR